MPNSVGIVCPVWREARYLPLVLEQMSCVPAAAKIILWQNEPLFWLGSGLPPSGFDSKVKDILPLFPHIEVIKMDHAPVRSDQDDTEYGGFTSLAKLALQILRDRGIDILVWIDSDWLLELNEMGWLCALLAESRLATKYWYMWGPSYWRDFKHCEGDPKFDTRVAYRTTTETIWEASPEPPYGKRLPITYYHPGWVRTDDEIYEKVHSFGHAKYYQARGWWEKEWYAKDDSRMDVRGGVTPPFEIIERLKKWDCLEPGWL